MLFNSVAFLVFVVIVFILYWFVFNKNLSTQNLLLLVVSYIFYGWWDWRFVFLLAFSTFLDFYSGQKIAHAPSQRSAKLWLIISVTINLGFLGVFKYYNFFVSSFAELLHSFGFAANMPLLYVVLPVGISFYTFHGLSYVFDIYYKRISPTNNFTDYAVFVSFFPLLVAGPIERATHLLPQVEKPRTFNYSLAVDGMRQVLWGLFKKVVIADNCAEVVDQIFGSGQSSGSTVLVGSVLFAFQIYCDFSGYSDIALGVARIFGFELLRNFAYPYFSRDIAEFWRRWHISLSSWFKDYVYKPLGGSRGGTWMQIRNTFIIFLLSGFWHGANWTFIAWGFINACYFLPLLLMKKNRQHTDIVAEGRLLPSFKEALQILLTFFITTIAWIFFRAETVSDAISSVGRIFSPSLFSRPTVFPVLIFAFIGVLLIAEWLQRSKQHALQFNSTNIARPVRWSIYFALIVSILFVYGSSQQFIYFQF